MGLIILLYKSLRELVLIIGDEVYNDSTSHSTDHIPSSGTKIVNLERLKV
jgi:hypothetical protein